MTMLAVVLGVLVAITIALDPWLYPGDEEGRERQAWLARSQQHLTGRDV